MENNQNTQGSPADELAAIEAEIREAQERLEAARQRVAAESQPEETSQQAAEQPAAQPAADQVPPYEAAQPQADPAQAYQQAPQDPYQQVPPQGAPQGQPYQYQQPYQGYQQPYQQANQPYTPYVATKDHVAAGLLAIFLGSLGIHKFYLGYNTAGFIMLGVTLLGSLLTFGFAAAVIAIIGIVEGVLYLTKPQPEFERQYVYSKREWF